MAGSFKPGLFGMFSFGRPSGNVLEKVFISLLDNRHVFIKLSSEEDYSRIWVRQTWYFSNQGTRIFKWNTTFHCSAESPIMHVCVSLPDLPLRFLHCKSALFSISAFIGTSLRVDHAMTNQVICNLVV